MSATVHFNVTEIPENELIFSSLGTKPYVLIEIGEADHDEDHLALDITVGGGTPAEPLSDIADFLTMTGDLLGRDGIKVSREEGES